MTAEAGRPGPMRVANCGGFYGDRLSAAAEMVEGGPIDVLTGDWLAELTMSILAGNRLKGRPGYARTFLTQMEQVLGTCLDRGIRVVANAGGLDPAGCAEAVSALADRLGLRAAVAHVTGDDLMPLAEPPVNADTGETLRAAPLTANAYLGGRPIAVALEHGADVVVTGRVTDAALVTGPGMWWFGWDPSDLDPLAGSVVAGHVIECGCQATGGNYAFFGEVPDLAHCGFPIAELYADGSSVITKHPGTGGLVSTGTVTAQLLYEIASPRYLGPDVTARFDTVRLEQEGPDRVRITGVRGEPPPDTLKVAVTYLGGHRNTMTLVLTGLDIAAKARIAQEAIWARVPRESFEQVHVELTPLGGGDAGTALLRITVMDPDPRRAGRAFSSAVVETGLASYPGFYGLTPPGDASPYGVYWPSSVDAQAVLPVVTVDGFRVEVPHVPPSGPVLGEQAGGPPPGDAAGTAVPPYAGDLAAGPVAPLGTVAGARSGDKGGDANLGVWVRDPARYPWLAAFLTVDRLRELLPEVGDLPIERFALPNLHALNFVVHGLLGRGVAASPLLDAQAKALGERLRAVCVPVPP
ncbi:acyclic terpene utilization AtuA family protein [Microbispora catharanthi]|uniref:Acyclic terpene utilization AtuA family protein n=1 Tax=Microbispora catharanthi TaxID=1712871 RepID=A0A5N6BX74_9ACTN|nr:acyclic terpene utilization AtuA family protein [Microbispora catharanthi]KAB8185067.1 acyclic terpene utilization AtuA family protein [Microbispora catharanthi]